MASIARPGIHLHQLDGLRGCALILVLFEHFTYNDWIRSWSPGSAGVRIFFVLSGFLITGILLADRERFDVGTIARRFFWNRALRLLPAFLVAVALAAALGIADMRADWLWHISYLSNLQVVLEGRWTGAGHFWTLAVEQQFYLLWFPLVVLLPRRWLLPTMLGLIAGAFLFRGLIVAGRAEFINVLIPAQADALALGALLAWAVRNPRLTGVLAGLGRSEVMWPVIGLAVIISAPWPGVVKPMVLLWVVQPALLAMASGAVILRVVSYPKAVALLGWPVLVGLGRISYGLYIFHYFVPQVLNLYVPFVAGLTEGPEKLLRVVVWTGLSVLLATASWRWIEKPALRMKAGAGASKSSMASGQNDSKPHKSGAMPSSGSR